ncbi:hypothetical protein ACKI1L_37285, partial [Streptomyces scabiei]|uniref:hypothetical protein n=1 Tax=Streptomyces scabiei TaxID=1930 RepID=UPI0038F7F070
AMALDNADIRLLRLFMTIVEAGGFAAQFDRAPYRPGVVAGGLICAPDEASWTALHDAFLGSDPVI